MCNNRCSIIFGRYLVKFRKPSFLVVVLLFISLFAESTFIMAAPGAVENASNGAAQNGWLHVEGTQLVNEAGNPVILRGMSSHGLQWFPQFTTGNAIGATAAYGANLFRIAMYTAEGGYLSHKRAILQKLYRAVDAAVARNMYVIIDWHILRDGNPMKHRKAAVSFFRKVSSRYKNSPNVLYEICNEPNGKGTWKKICSYANSVIPAIRRNSPGSIVLVGTPSWSQDVDTAAQNPLPYPNLMYSCHFYAGTHGEWLREKIETALRKGLPVFVSEWGTSHSSGRGGVCLVESDRWISFMNRHMLSWANWSYCNKRESSASVKKSANVEDGISEIELTKSGRYVFSQFGA